MGHDLCPNFLKPLLEKIDRRSCNDGSQGENRLAVCSPRSLTNLNLRPVPCGSERTVEAPVLCTSSYYFDIIRNEQRQCLEVLRESFKKKRNKSGPIKGTRWIPLRTGMAPEISPKTYTFKTPLKRHVSRPKDLIFVKRNLWLTESTVLATSS